MKTILKTAISLSILLAATAVLSAAPEKPAPGGQAVLGNVSAQYMPSPTLRMSAQPYAYPTNRWWGITYIQNTAFTQPPYSLMMSLGISYLKYYNDFPGYRLIAPNIGLRNGNKDVSGQVTETGYLRLCVSSVSTTQSGDYAITPTQPAVLDYSDWAVKTEIHDTSNADIRMTTTFLKGGVFTYNTFSSSAYPLLRFWPETYPYNPPGKSGIILSQGGGGVEQWFAIFAPEGTLFRPRINGWSMEIVFPDTATEEEDRYLVVAYLGSRKMYPNINSVIPLFNEYYKYAYNFVTDTKVSWARNNDSSISTTLQYTLSPKRTGTDFVSGQTLFALYPHQWKHLADDSQATLNAVAPEYTTLRGKMKVYQGTSFKTKYEFHGMLPSLTYEVPSANRSRLEGYISTDSVFTLTGTNTTYRRGKAMAKAANLITVFHQAGKIAQRDAMIARLKAELVSWYKGTGGHSLQYDSVWGGIIGTPGDFDLNLYNDHHFHYGYFVYASAILAMYDPEFATASQYKGIVDLLIKDYANPERPGANNRSFPFLRNFDVYEGHSWSNGKGSSNYGDYGNDQESISEAMNSWAAIYLWGIVTNNTEWIELGMYGYTTESQASEEYYFDTDNEAYPASYTHRGGIFLDSGITYGVHWPATTAQEIYGIWMLPLTPSMLYLGYSTSTVRSYLDKLSNESNNNPSMWKDIFLRYKSLYDAPGALSEWHSWASPASEEGSSLSFSYHFINFFNAFGTVSTDYYALDDFGNSVPFTVMKSSDNAYTFIAYNSSAYEKNIRFYPRTGFAAAPNNGVMPVPAGRIAKTKDFKSFKYDFYDTGAAVLASSNTALDVYSVYSDNFLGAVVGGNAYQDALTQENWSGTVSFSSYSSFAGSFEGKNYFAVSRINNVWGGWGFSFAGGVIDMSSFYNGKMEVSLRIGSQSPVAGAFDIGFETVNGQFWFPLLSLGFDPTSTDWQTVSVPLSGASVTADDLSRVKQPFIMKHNGGSSQSEWGIPVYVDSVLWKKANASGSCSAKLKNRSDNRIATSINWLNSDFRQENAVAQQYIEISLNAVEGNTWGIQIYTDNKSSFTAADVEFGGDISTYTVSGLVNSIDPEITMLPMRWRPASSTIADTEVLLPHWQDPWKHFRDAWAFDSGTALHSGCDELKFMDRRGFRFNASEYGDLPDDKKIRLYFIADFTKAKLSSLYIANIIIEYFNE